MAAETVIESFCERCGTRYTFEPVRKRDSKLVGLGKQLGILLEDHATSLAQRDPFHGTFHFCLECRQYTCPRCWNESAGFCLGCMPLPGTPDTAALDAAEAEAGLEADVLRQQASAEHDVLGAPDAWPDADLPRRSAAPAVWPEAALATALTVVAPIDSETQADMVAASDEEPWSLTFGPALPEPDATPDLAELEAAELEAVAVTDEAEDGVRAMTGATEGAEPVDAVDEGLAWFDEVAEIPPPMEALAIEAALADEPAMAVAADAIHDESTDRTRPDARPLVAGVAAAVLHAPDDAEIPEAVALAGADLTDEAMEAEAAVEEPTVDAEAEAGLEETEGVAAVESERDAEAAAAIAEAEAEPEAVAIAELEAVAEPEAEAEAVVAADATIADAEPASDPIEALAIAAIATTDPETEPAPQVVVTADADDEADWADLIRHLPPAPEDDASTADWSVMAPALGPDIAAAQEPVAPARSVAPSPTPAPAPAIAWQLSPPLPDGEQRPTAWPPLGPVFRPAPTPPPSAPHPSVLAPRPGAGGGVLARGHAAGPSSGAMPNGVRPCRNCELPLSASARFCRRCGRPQA